MDSAFTAEDHYRRGIDALYASHYGLALGLAERRLDRALELCREAAKREFFNPVHYLNLARLHLAFGFKAEAVRYLRRGLMIDPGNGPIASAMRELGVRRRPPLGFLRRQNLLNRWIGRLTRRASAGPDIPELTAFGV